MIHRIIRLKAPRSTYVIKAQGFSLFCDEIILITKFYFSSLSHPRTARHKQHMRKISAWNPKKTTFAMSTRLCINFSFSSRTLFQRLERLFLFLACYFYNFKVFTFYYHSNASDMKINYNLSSERNFTLESEYPFIVCARRTRSFLRSTLNLFLAQTL